MSGRVRLSTPPRRLGSWIFTLMTMARDPIFDERLFLAAKPAKHWVRPKDWTQREPNRRKRKKR